MPEYENMPDQAAHDQVDDVQRRAIERKVEELASDLELSVQFSQGRRATDIMIVEVGGRLDQTLAFYTRITDEYPHYDLELFNSGSGDAFGRKAAITRKLSEQPRRPNERRARLKFLDEENDT